MEKSRKIGARSLAERWRKKKEAWGAAQRDREGGEGEEEGRDQDRDREQDIQTEREKEGQWTGERGLRNKERVRSGQRDQEEK